MAVRIVLRLALIGSVVFGARSVVAAPISSGAPAMTGNVAKDFTLPGAQIFQGPLDTTPAHIGQASWMNTQRLVSGWNFNYIATYYNAQTDTMYVGVKNWGISGDVDGKGLIGKSDPQLTSSGGSNPANFAGDKSMAIAFAPLSGTYNPSNPPAPVLVAGVPYIKSQADPSGLDGFTVAKWSGTGGPPYDLAGSFGHAITNTGSMLYFNPSAATPNFEFKIVGFKALTGINPANGFMLYAQDGSIGSIVTGTDYLMMPSTEAQQVTPEPATWLLWAGLAGGLAWKYRRTRRSCPSRHIVQII
jgi:hypothetical protein